MTTATKVRFYIGGGLVALSLFYGMVRGQDHSSVVAHEVTRLGGSEALRNNKPLLATLMRNIAIRLGPPYGVLIKTSGNNCDGIACDIICIGNGPGQRQFDVLGDEGGESVPTWGEVGNVTVRECVVPSSTVPAPPGQPQQPLPVPTPSPEILDALERIEEAVGAISCGGGGLTDEQYANIVRLISVERPVEVSKGGIFGGTFKGKVGGVR